LLAGEGRRGGTVRKSGEGKEKERDESGWVENKNRFQQKKSK
jgi:hypothetical protein